MQKFLFLLIFSICSVNILAQDPSAISLTNYGVRIEPDKRLMVVLAALEMAGSKDDSGQFVKLINTPLSEKGAKFRKQLLDDNADLDNTLRQRITAFVSQYKKLHPKASDEEVIAPFISMAYALTPVPELGDPVVTTDLPGNLLDVLDFAPLVRDFYRRSNISGNGGKWNVIAPRIP